MTTDMPPLPDRGEWARFGIGEVVEFHAGEQSRVVRAQLDGVDVAIKLTDRRFADPTVLDTRMALVETLAIDVAEIVGPLRIDHALVQPTDAWLMTATPFVQGDPVDPDAPGTGHVMGRTLALLHVALASVDPPPLPTVAALSDTAAEVDRSGWQLLHGDFNDQNMVASPSGLRVYDFDDCGYGPIEFDVANTLYMVLFDADLHDRPERYERFRPALLDGYATASGTNFDSAVIDGWIDVRIDALGRWLDDLDSAPIGIRASSAEWQDLLRDFVSRRRGSTTNGAR